MIENREDIVVYHGSIPQVVLDNLQPGMKYSFHVRASNLVGDGPWSDLYTFLIVEKPSKPLDLKITGFDKTYVALMWDQPLHNGG